MKDVRGTAAVMLLAVATMVGYAYGVSAASVRIAEQSSAGTTFEVVIPEPETTTVLVDTMPFVVLSVEGAYQASVVVGRPQLPRVSVLLAVPRGCTTSISIERLVTHDVTVGRVYPEQAAVCLNDTAASFAFDRSFYDTCSSYYTGTYLRPVDSGIWRDLQVLSIEVLPVQFNPSLGSIRVADTIVVRVNYAGGSGYPARVADWMAPIYAQTVDNFAELELSFDARDTVAGIRCMVFCHDSLASSDSRG
jgi:hypothetical protein